LLVDRVTPWRRVHVVPCRYAVAGNPREREIIRLPHLRGRGITTAATATTESTAAVVAADVSKTRQSITLPATGPNLQLRSEVARGTALLALTGLTASVAALPVATVAATATAAAEPPLTALLLAHHAARGGMGPLLLDVGSRDNLGGQVKPLPEVVETLGGEGVVVVLPRELGLDVAARGQGLASLDDEQVANAGLVGRLIAAEVYELASAATRGRVLSRTR
jgi:hypothetical protein